AFEILNFFDGTLQIIGAKIKKESPLIGKKFFELAQIKEEHNFLIAGIQRKDLFLIPSGKSQIFEGDKVYFVTKKELAQKGMGLLGYKKEKFGKIMINGASFIGRNLASTLEAKGITVKLIEPDPHLCSIASRDLNNTLLLNAAGTDQEVLEQENIHKMDAFVSVTKDDEENIISSLLAKRLGCPVAISLSHKIEYLPLISSMGIDAVINPRQLTKNAITHFLRQGRVLNESQLTEFAEIIELEALETSDIVNTPIHKIQFPKPVLILSIKRNDEIIVPWGDTIIEPGDRVLLITQRRDVSKLEKFISVKLEYF
ncbi:NAD-binding protein, partial [bacterium]|nr:NAD-binding protein [bacterium]